MSIPLYIEKRICLNNFFEKSKVNILGTFENKCEVFIKDNNL